MIAVYSESKGALWIQKHQDLFEQAARPSNFKDLVKNCPTRSGVLYETYKILATKDPYLIKSFYGLDAISVEHIRMDFLNLRVEHLLNRGVRGTHNMHAKTNCSYFPRILSFLEFLDQREHLQVSYTELAEQEFGRTPEDAEVLLPPFRGRILLANGTNVADFLTHCESVRSQVVRTCRLCSFQDLRCVAGQ